MPPSAQPAPARDPEKGSPKESGAIVSSSLPLHGESESEKLEEGARTSSDFETAPKDHGDALPRPASRSQGRDGGDGGVVAKVLSRVLTRASTKSHWDPGPPPDGGLKAWAAGKPLPAVALPGGIVND